MIVDQIGRQFRNLRISLTAACNYACTYCVPDGKRLLPADAELSAEDMNYLVRLLVEVAGIEKIRITGGEPLLSPKFDDVISQVDQLDLKDVAITTNGQLIPRKEAVLRASTVRRVNVSLDTLDRVHFRDIARSGDVDTVLKGIDLLLDMGCKVKINTVPMRSQNYHQLVPLLEYAMQRGVELRYIELMNMGHLRASKQYQQDFVGMAEILELIGQKYTVETAYAPPDATATRFKVLETGQYFGVIANESAPFCAGCNRLRLSSNGQLFGCLSNSKSYDLTSLLNLSQAQAVAALQQKLDRALGDKQQTRFSGEVTVMKFIGG